MRFWTRIVAGAGLLALVPLAGVAAQGAPLGTPIPGKPLGTTVEGGGSSPGHAFLAHQISFSRVAEARDATDGELRLLFHDKGITYPAPEIFLRVFKHERVMELWARSAADSTFTLMKEYRVCALPGQLGPKVKMGDFQVPEGFYYIDEFNPQSAYHLSLRVSYPNLSDRLRREVVALGGDIFVHGGCETVGCVPIEDQNIKEVYWLAAQAMDAGQQIIPIHIFPTRMDDQGMRWLESTFEPDPSLLEFWNNLAEGFDYFEATHSVPWITVAQDGRYTIPSFESLAAGDAGETPDEAPNDGSAPTIAPAAPADTVDATTGSGTNGGR